MRFKGFVPKLEEIAKIIEDTVFASCSYVYPTSTS